jgi:hypothetical protein
MLDRIKEVIKNKRYSNEKVCESSGVEGKLEIPLSNEQPKSDNTKYFGVGYPKTGTNTMAYCFRLLGYRDIKVHDYFINWFQNGYDVSNIISDEIFCNYIECYDIFSDWPFHMIYKELDKKYPGSKFILTERKNQETWQRSIANHRKTRSKEELRKWAKKIPRYRANHNEEVIDYFNDRPDDLLVLCWEKGDGWKELCNFLNVSIPNLPFPHKNKTRILNFLNVNFIVNFLSNFSSTKPSSL